MLNQLSVTRNQREFTVHHSGSRQRLTFGARECTIGSDDRSVPVPEGTGEQVPDGRLVLGKIMEDYLDER